MHIHLCPKRNTNFHAYDRFNVSVKFYAKKAVVQPYCLQFEKMYIALSVYFKCIELSTASHFINMAMQIQILRSPHICAIHERLYEAR